MGEVLLKYGRPMPTEFASDDLCLDVDTGNIYYKDKKGDLHQIVNTTPAVILPTLSFPSSSNPSYSGNSSNNWTGPITVTGDLTVTGTLHGTLSATASLPDPIRGGIL